MIWEWIKLYLLIGAGVIGFEWIALIIARRRFLESDKAKERVAEVMAFVIEILIWPYQLYASIDAYFKIKNGTMSDEELGWFNEGYLQGLELKKKWNKNVYKIEEDYEK